MNPVHEELIEKTFQDLEESGISQKEIIFFFIAKYNKGKIKKKKYTLKDFQKLRGYYDGDPDVSKNIDSIVYDV